MPTRFAKAVAVSLGVLVALSSPTLAREAARCVQTELARLGFAPGPADGVLGRRSFGAASQFQEAAALDLPELTKATAPTWCEALQRFAQTPAALSVAPVRIERDRISGTKKGYSHQIIDDPTGLVGGRVERFELRGGDCSDNSDCTPRGLGGRTVTRARVERVLETALRDGANAVVSYKVYFPSAEFTLPEGVRGAYGQVLSGYRRNGRYDSIPITTFDSSESAFFSTLLAQAFVATEDENEQVKSVSRAIGSFRNGLYDRWIDIEIQLRLRESDAGQIRILVDGEEEILFEGRTLSPGNFMEVRYGIYQTGTNFYATGAQDIPTQVVYYSGMTVRQGG